MSRDANYKRKTKGNTAKNKYEKNGKFTGKAIRAYQERIASNGINGVKADNADKTA